MQYKSFYWAAIPLSLSYSLSLIFSQNYQSCKTSTLPWHSGKVVAFWPWGHGFKSWKQPLVEIQEKTVYIRPKVVGPFSGPYVSESYLHRAALLVVIALF
jgi:hypothetical protein